MPIASRVKRFDYGEFRTVEELATVGFDTFAFVFEEAGTYVFISSCDAASIIVLAVMQDGVRLVYCRHLNTGVLVYSLPTNNSLYRYSKKIMPLQHMIRHTSLGFGASCIVATPVIMRN